MLLLADGLLYALHVGVIVFNVFGWIPRRTRRWNLLLLFLTAFSWLALGAVYGVGYCFLTDWEWRVRAAMGRPETAGSFVELLIRSLTGVPPDPGAVRLVSGIVGGAAVVASLTVNLRDRAALRRERRSAAAARRG